jgi:hypothetical protein
MRSIARAMGVGVCVLCAVIAATAQAAPASNAIATPVPTPDSASLSMATDLLDPQPDAGGEPFPPLAELERTPPPASLFVQTTESPPVLRFAPRHLNDTPMAPLPPAVVAGPITFAAAAWMARRANRRGGRI